MSAPGDDPLRAARSGLRRLLLTGAGGLIGRSLLPALRAEGFEVLPAGRSLPPPSGGEPEGFAALARGDLADPARCRDLLRRFRPEAVLHLAGGAGGGRNELYRSNVLPTVHLLEAAGELEAPPYFVVFGSAAEYGAHEGRIGEDAPLRPLTDYGRAKLAQTALAQAIGAERGIPLSVLRPFNVVARDLPASSALGYLREQLLASRDERRRVVCGRLDVVRDFVPVSTVVDAVVALVRSPAPGQAINVCTGVGLDVESVLRAMAAELGTTLEIAVDEALARLPAAPAAVGDPARMRELLGVSATPSPASLARLLLA